MIIHYSRNIQVRSQHAMTGLRYFIQCYDNTARVTVSATRSKVPHAISRSLSIYSVSNQFLFLLAMKPIFF